MNLSSIVGGSILLLVTGWGVLLVAAVGCVAAAIAYGLKCLRSAKPAGRQHWLVTGLFAASLAIPVALMLLAQPSDWPSRQSSAASKLTGAAARPADLSATRAALGGFRGAPPLTKDALVDPAPVVRALGAIWSVLVLVMGVRLAGGLWLVGRIRRRSRLQPAGSVGDIARRAGLRLGLPREVPIRESSDVGTPVTAGWRRPVVLLPAGLADALAPPQLELLLAHELSHVLRRDFLTSVLQSFGDVLTLHSPGHRWLSKEARRLRELACDDEVLASGADPHAYAAALERLAGLSDGREIAVPMCAANRDLAARVQRLIGAGSRSSLNRTGALAACAVLIVGVLMAAVVIRASGESLARAKAVREPQTAKDGIVPNPVAHGARELGKFPTGWAIRQDGSPIRIEDTKPSSDVVFKTVTVKNVFPKGITSVTFGAFIDSQGARQVSLTRSNPIDAAIEPGTSQVLAADLFPVDRVPEVRALGSRGLLMLGVLEVTFEDGSRWSAPLDESAKRFNAALGIPNATVPRSYISSSALPPPPGGHAASFCYYGESEIDVTSQGGVMEIAGEAGQVATCVNGRWVEGFHSPR